MEKVRPGDLDSHLSLSYFYREIVESGLELANDIVLEMTGRAHLPIWRPMGRETLALNNILIG